MQPELELRPYQIEAVHELRLAVAKHGSVVFVLPTGGGKTIVAAKIAQLAFAKDNRTLFLVHRRELVKQAVDTLSEAVPGASIGVEARDWPSQPWAPLQVGMVQTINRRKKTIKRPDLIVVDEAHHARAKTWENVFKLWPDVPRIGLTATPQRLDGKGLGEHFAKMVLGPTIPELVEMENLAPTITRRIPSGLALSEVPTDRNGEYRQSDIRDQVNETLVGDAVQAYLDYGRRRRAIFFGIHTGHSMQVCESLRQSGVRAAHLDGTDSTSHRDRVMNQFRTGGLDVIGNCELFTEGLDVPDCEIAILGAPTRSVTKYMQAGGRPMRWMLDKTAEVWDLAGISFELGLVDDEREWSLEDGEIKQSSNGESLPRACPKCKALFYGKTCKACGETAPALALSEVKQVKTHLEVAESGSRRQPKMRQPELRKLLAQARRAENPRAALEQIAEQNEYHPKWIDHIARVWNLSE